MGATARVRMGQCGIHRRGNCEDQQRQPSSLLGNQHGAAMPALDYANIDHAAELIAQSDALIIAAGAGIGRSHPSLPTARSASGGRSGSSSGAAPWVIHHVCDESDM